MVVAVAALAGAGACSDDPTEPAGEGAAATVAAAPQPAPPRPSPGCDPATPAPPRGSHTDEVVAAGGSTGRVWRYVPASYEPGTAAPLVLDLHGVTQPYGTQPSMSGFPAIADREGFVYAAPTVDAPIPFWSSDLEQSIRDDVGFLRGVIDATAAAVCIDLARVYVAGMSNGALMASVVACELADEVAAVAPVAGLRFPPGCEPERAVPVIAFHGTADEFVSFQTGGPGPAVAGLTLPAEFAERIDDAEFVPIPEAAERWAAADGCTAGPQEQEVSDEVRLLRWSGCRDGARVELYVVEGGGHTWPGSDFLAGEAGVALVGPTTFDVRASELIWEFFSDYAL